MRLELSGKLWKRELILFFTIVFYIILKKLKKKKLLECNTAILQSKTPKSLQPFDHCCKKQKKVRDSIV